ncbi:reverse transcriptase domain-containing protein, partial [Tanacetum coccineum]
MVKEDEDKTVFITSQGIFYYSKMPFGLKNVGATYQRLVDKAFQKQIGRNLEVYIDDLGRGSHVLGIQAEAAFKQMKRLIAELPTLTTPMEKEELIVYLAAAQEGISTVLMAEREAKKMLVYFVSRALQVHAKNISKRINLSRFIVERPEDDSLVTNTEAKEELSDPWTLFTDGSSCIDGFGAGLI